MENIKRNGIDVYDTSISKFVQGGRFIDALNGSNKIVNGMEDPSHLAFVFGIEESNVGLFSTSANPVLFDKNTDANYGVLNYLENAISPNTNNTANGNTSDSAYKNVTPDDLYDTKTNTVKSQYRTFKNEYLDMKNFVNGFRTIIVNHPYMFQSIEGLQDAYKKYYNMHKEPFLGGTDNKIKIKCLESMDLRMSALFDAYFRAVYNHKYRKMNIPINLLRFNCYVLVHDLRNLRVNSDELMSSITGDPRTASITEDIVTHMSTMIFRFKLCEIDIEDIGSMLSTVSNTEKNVTNFEFSIKYNDVDFQLYSLADFFEYKNKSDYKKHESPTEFSKTDGYALNTTSSNNTNVDTLKSQNTFNSEEILDGYDTSLDMTGMLKKAGSYIFNKATSRTQMGNVYDESWAGILSSIMSSISTGGVDSIINNALGAAHSHISYLYGYNDVIPHKELPNENVYKIKNNLRGETNPYTGETNDALSENEFESIYENESTDNHESLTQDNIYLNSTSQHQQMTPGNTYSNIISQHQLMNPDNAYSNINSQHQQLNPDNAYSNINSQHQQFSPDTIYIEPEHDIYLSFGNNYNDINSYHQELESNNAYAYNTNNNPVTDLGKAFEVSQINLRYIPTNVYDRISEYKKGNDIPVEKIYVKPEKEKESTFEKVNSNEKNIKQRIRNQISGIGNVYSSEF